MSDPLRDALESIAGWRKVNIQGEYEHGLRDIIRSITECAAAALDHGVAQTAVTSGTLTFGALVENIAASDRNPIKRGIFIRKTSAKMAEYATKEGCHSTPLDNLRASNQGASK